MILFIRSTGSAARGPVRFAAALAAGFLATVATTATGARAAPGDLAGVSAAVRGDVRLTSVLSEAVRPVASGEDVLFGDALATGERSGMQLLLLDQSVFTIGAEARLVVDSFVYDPASGVGELSAELLKGAFRFVSGGLSAKDPEQVRLRVPEATIGVRGTIVSALVADGGSYVLLDGPGRGNDAFARRGLVTVSAGGRTVELSRPGYATFVAAGAAPLEPFEAPAELRGRLAGALAVRPAPSESPAEAGAEPRQAEAAGEDSPAADPVASSGVGTTTRALATLATDQTVGALTVAAVSAEPDDPEGRGSLGGDDATSAAALTADVDRSLSETLDLVSLETLARIDGLNSSAIDHYAGDGSFKLTRQGGETLSEPLSGTARLSLTIDFGRRALGDANSGVRVTAGDFSKVMVIDHLGFDEALDGYAFWVQSDAKIDDLARDGSYIVITGKNGVASELSTGLILEHSGDAGTAVVKDAPRLQGASPGLP